jgi:hypothetical protein
MKAYVGLNFPNWAEVRVLSFANFLFQIVSIVIEDHLPFSQGQRKEKYSSFTLYI